jgi:hypothetical protein
MTSFPSDFSSQPCEKKKTSIHETQIASPEDLAFAKSSTPTPIHKSLEDLEEPNPPSPPFLTREASSEEVAYIKSFTPPPEASSPFLTREASSEEVAYIKSFTPPPEASSPFLTREASSEEVAYIKSFTPPPDSPQWSNKTLTFPKEELEGESYADDPYKTSALELQDSSLAPKVERTLDIPVEEFDRLMTPPPTVPAPFVHGETNSHTPSKLPSPSTPAPKGVLYPCAERVFYPCAERVFYPLRRKILLIFLR